jgi:hypothetical protein
MLTAFARFGERAETIVAMPGVEGGQTAWKEVRGGRRPAFDAATAITTCTVQAPPAPGAGPYLPAAILLINSSTRQLSCSFS